MGGCDLGEQRGNVRVNHDGGLVDFLLQVLFLLAKGFCLIVEVLIGGDEIRVRLQRIGAGLGEFLLFIRSQRAAHGVGGSDWRLGR